MATAQLLSREENVARIKITIGADEVDDHFKKIYKELAKTLKIPGFRKGKIPENVIRQRVGAETITDAAADDLKHFAIDSALDELKLSPRGGNANWHSEPDPQPGQANEYEFSIPVLPEVTLPDYAQYEMTVPVLPVTDEMKEAFRQRLQERYTDYPLKEGASAAGDALMVSFTTTEADSDEQLPLGAEHLRYVIGVEGNFPGWDEQLTAKEAGATVEFDFTVPADFTDPRVAGKRVRIHLNITSVHTRAVPDLDEEFIKEHLKLEKMEEFEEYINNMLTRERDHQVLRAKSQLILQKITAEMTAEITADMISDELDGLVTEYDQQLRQHNSSLDQFLKEQQRTLPEYRESLTAGAVQKIKTFLVVKAVSDEQNLSATSEDFQRYALYLMQYEGIPAEQIQELLKNPEFIRETTYQILREKVLAHLVASVKFNEESAGDEGEDDAAAADKAKDNAETAADAEE